MIPYIQPIFVPNAAEFLINADSIRSFAAYMKEFPYDVKVVFGGWASSNALWKRIKTVIEENFDTEKVIIKRFDRNYGKAYVVNRLFELIGDEDFEYFLTADSDMKFTLEIPHLFERLLEMTVESKKQRLVKPGLIALNQLEHNCHLKHIYDNKYKYTNSFGDEELFVHAKGPGGMGGGSFFISKAGWIEVGGYRVMGVYAGDDAYLLIDLGKAGYTTQMSDTIALIHPHHGSQSHAKWKGAVCQRDSGPKKSAKKYDEIIRETEEYWKNKDKKI